MSLHLEDHGSVFFISIASPGALPNCPANMEADTVYPNGVGRVSLSGLANGWRDLTLLKTGHSGI